MYTPKTVEEAEFLKHYDPGKFEKPSVTADVVLFTILRSAMHVLLIRRGGFPYKGCWAFPGGFVGMEESVDEAAARELSEETGLSGIPVHQFGTFGAVDRDPRMRVISVAYMAFLPAARLSAFAGNQEAQDRDLISAVAGDDAADAQFFEIRETVEGLAFIGPRNVLKEEDLAFDHIEILKRALTMLKNRIDYTDDAFSFLNDQDFTIYELQKVVETVKGRPENLTNFRRIFANKYLKTGLVVETGEKSTRDSRKPAATYRRLRS